MWKPDEWKWLEEAEALWCGLLFGFVKKKWVILQTVKKKKKLSSYTERGEKDCGLWGRIVLRQFFSSLCRISWERQKTLNSDPQRNVWLVCRVRRWFEQEKHHTQWEQHWSPPRRKKTPKAHDSFLHILYCVLDVVKKTKSSKPAPIPHLLVAVSCCVSGLHDTVGIPDVAHGILLHLWSPNVT